MIVVCLVALTGFIFAASVTFRTGFPLDDAWIHQTFARNLVQFKEWSFNPGYPTSGSTSPLWTLLLAPSFILKTSTCCMGLHSGRNILMSDGNFDQGSRRTLYTHQWNVHLYRGPFCHRFGMASDLGSCIRNGDHSFFSSFDVDLLPDRS